MNKKIVCLQGIPASGKSTWAKDFVARNPGWFRVNKDDIRKSLGINYEVYDKQKEQKVIDAERTLVSAMTLSGMNVIVDNTHLVHKFTRENKHLKYYEALAKDRGYDFEIKTFYIDEDEARKRDAERPKEERVGQEVFDRMKKYSEFPGKYPQNPVFKKEVEGLKPCIICDLDGTLAFMDGKRSPYDYSKVSGDVYNSRLGALLKVFEKTTDAEVIFLSGRKSDCANETKNWLIKNGWKNNYLLMRNKDDNRKDSIVKKELYEKYIKDKYNVFAVFDDRNQVIDMWREEGLPTYQVWYGDF